jgi:anaerobic ribonucleoside-triphosphate reductase activating protein
MLIHSKTECTIVNGPGRRAALWFQGCTLGCAGCWNEGTHPFSFDGFKSWSEVQTWLVNLPTDIEGITLSGGEPMQHALDVLMIANFMLWFRPGFSIGMFTGYTERELEKGMYQTLDSADSRFVQGAGDIWAAIRDRIDFAVMGRFNASLVTLGKPLCGSMNQTIRLFSNRYTLADFGPQEIEITIGPHDGQMCATITGFPGRELLTSIKTAL